MNTLSILIYAAGVAESLDHFLGIITGLCVIGALACVALHLCALDCGTPQELRKHISKWFKVLTVGGFLCGIAASLMPSRETVLMVAASEMAGRAVMSEPVQSVVDPATQLLREWIDQKTRELRNANR